jgi:hypothetical protein
LQPLPEAQPWQTSSSLSRTSTVVPAFPPFTFSVIPAWGAGGWFAHVVTVEFVLVSVSACLPLAVVGGRLKLFAGIRSFVCSRPIAVNRNKSTLQRRKRARHDLAPLASQQQRSLQLVVYASVKRTAYAGVAERDATPRHVLRVGFSRLGGRGTPCVHR